MIKVCKEKKRNAEEVNQKNIINSFRDEKKEMKEKSSPEDKENVNVNSRGKGSLPKKYKDCIFEIVAVDKLKKNNKRTNVQMKELKLIPTRIFWLQIIALLPLCPILPVFFYPYCNCIHQFQIVWAAILLAFKSGARWMSTTLQQKSSDIKIHNKKSKSWNCCKSWGSLSSPVIPSCLAALAVFLSFPLNYIILTYAFLKILFEDLSSKTLMPKGYLELEIITCIFAVIAVLFVFISNTVYLVLE